MRFRNPQHGRDHRFGGVDAIPGLVRGMLHWGTNDDDDGLGLVLNAEEDVQINTDSHDFGVNSGGANINLISASQALLEGSTVIVDGSSSVTLEGGAVFTNSANIENKLTGATDRWRVADAAGASILEIIETGSIDANSHKIHNVTDPTSAQDAATKAYVDGATGATSPLTTKGDLFTHSTVDTRLGVGSNDTVLVADSAQTTGLKWVKVGEAQIALTDVTTDNVTSSAHGFAPKSPGSAGQYLNGGATPGWSAVTDAQLSTSDITTNDVSTSKHGFVPKAPNDTAKFLRGDGTWNSAALPAGAAAMATDALWDAKGDLAAATGADAAVKVTVGANNTILVADSAQTAGIKWAGGIIGMTALVYRYTVAGSDKTSIDTGVDTADAGSNDWTNGDLLEVHLFLKTDESANFSTVNLNWNNDTSAIYNSGDLFGQTTSVGWQKSISQTKLQFAAFGTATTSAEFVSVDLTCPNYMSTVGNKAGTLIQNNAFSDTTNMTIDIRPWMYRSATALTRIAITPATSGKKFKVGSQILIYKRLAS